MRDRTILFTALMAITIFFSCGNISDKKIRIAYANWAEGIAVTYLAKEILSEQGYRTELLNADIAPHIHLSGKRQDRRVHGQLDAGDPCRLFSEIRW